MRSPVFLAAVASAAIVGAHPTAEESSSGHSFDKRTDFQALGGKILKTDLYAGLAGINQQLYQATKKPEQWKKCNPTDIVVRREW
jgi:tyrosinase